MAKKNNSARFSVFLLIFVIGVFAENISHAEQLIIKTAGREIAIDIELADTEEERSRGLMNRDQLADTSGMLFDFKRHAPVAMWMKNTRIPLDMIFTNHLGEILFIHENAEPFDLTIIQPPMPIYAVLEVNAGFVKKQKVQIGDRLVYTLFDR
ncbi:MAG: DUF192 domain-containing protein [Sneathiellales bacterium]|nr:DUF192 domain-containing protein [Sneathiellales bacterium]